MFPECASSPVRFSMCFPLITQQRNNTLLDFLRKEVIQPHLPIRLPCYDFTPVIEPAFGSSLPYHYARLTSCYFHGRLRDVFFFSNIAELRSAITMSRTLIRVGSLTSGISNSHGVTGGVYKTRERIHRDILIRDY